MTKPTLLIASALSLALLGACSSQDSTAPGAEASESASPAEADATATATPTPSESAAPEAVADPMVLRLEGLGDLAIGEPVPAGSSFAVRGAQIPGSDCKTVSSPDYPGVYAILEGGQVRRISVGGASKVKLVEGIGVGSSEADVLKAFPGFKSEPHEYVAAPAKYLTQPGSDPRLRFEIDDARKVSSIHVGLEPQLSYTEGCA